MNKNIFIVIILFGLLIILFLPTFDFHKSRKKGDLWRFPLIYPFELISPTKDDWFLKLEEFNPYSFKLNIPYQVSYIDSIGIVEGEIFLHSKKADFPGGSRPSWFTIEIIEKDSFKIKSYMDDEFNKRKINRCLNLHYAPKVIDEFQNSQRLPPEWEK